MSGISVVFISSVIKFGADSILVLLVNSIR